MLYGWYFSPIPVSILFSAFSLFSGYLSPSIGSSFWIIGLTIALVLNVSDFRTKLTSTLSFVLVLLTGYLVISASWNYIGSLLIYHFSEKTRISSFWHLVFFAVYLVVAYCLGKFPIYAKSRVRSSKSTTALPRPRLRTKNTFYGLISLIFWIVIIICVSFFSPITVALEENKWAVLPWFVAVVFFGLEFYMSMRVTTLYRYGDECLTITRNKILRLNTSKEERKKYEEISRKLSYFFKRRSITWSYCALASFWSLILVFVAFLLVLFGFDFWIIFFMGSVVFLALCLSIHTFRIGFQCEDWLMNTLAIFPFLKVEFPDTEELIDVVASGKWV